MQTRKRRVRILKSSVNRSTSRSTTTLGQRITDLPSAHTSKRFLQESVSLKRAYYLKNIDKYRCNAPTDMEKKETDD